MAGFPYLRVFALSFYVFWQWAVFPQIDSGDFGVDSVKKTENEVKGELTTNFDFNDAIKRLRGDK